MSAAWRRRLNGGKIQYLNELVTERQCLREPGFVLISTGKNNFVQIVIVEILLLVIDWKKWNIHKSDGIYDSPDKQ